MKILLVSAQSDSIPGGISSWTKEYIDYLKNTANDCCFVNTFAQKSRGPDSSKYSFLNEYKRFKRILKDLKGYLANQEFDVAHINDSCSPFGVIRDYRICKMLRKKGIPIVLHFHCDIEYQISRWRRLLKGISKRCFKKMLSISNSRIVLSKASRDFLNNYFNFDSRIVPNFIKPSNNTIKHIGEKIKNVFFVGHVIEEKGLNEMVFLASHYPEINITFIGEISNEINEKLQSLENVKILGVLTHEDVLKKLSNADVFLLPSHSEGFSLALLEAMSLGLPCIVTNVGANKEMIEEKGGITIDAKNSNQLVSAISMIGDKKVREKMSKWNIEKVKTCYVSEIVFPKYLNIYKEVAR